MFDWSCLWSDAAACASKALLLIARADLKVRLLFYSKTPFTSFLADVYTLLGSEPDPQSVAGLIRWEEDHLQVKISMIRPLSEVWWGPGIHRCGANMTAHPACLSLPTDCACGGAQLQSIRSVQTSWPKAEVGHFTLIFLHAKAWE